MEPDHKKCNECGEWKRVTEFHKRGRRHGRQQYDGRCKPCRNAIYRELYKDNDPSRTKEWEHRKAYLRARSRTFTRLAKIVPELYERILLEECKKEGVVIKIEALNTKNRQG